jgi:hypothetical protein
MFCMADSADDGDPRQLVRDELDRVRGTFARRVSEMTPADLRRPTNGTDWTNRELLFHMVFGYLVVRRLLPLVKALGHLPPHRSKPFAALLDASSRPFNFIHYLGSVGGGRALTPERMLRWLNSSSAKIERDMDRQDEASLRRGMHFPTRWDPYFKDFMTLADVYHYPTQHFDHHDRQLSL